MKRQSLAQISCYLGIFTNSIAVSIIFPYGSLMVQEFGLASDRSRAGCWVGLLAFAYMGTRTISSPLWGSVCDNWGRRPAALLSSAAVVVISLLFGFSQSYGWAMTCRGLLGACSCLVLVGRVSVAEITHSNPGAMGWGVIFAQTGKIAGDLIGGTFAAPNVSGLSDLALFGSFPFLLPNLIVSSLAIVSLLTDYFFLYETLDKRRLRGNFTQKSYLCLLSDRNVLYVLFLSFLVLFNESTFNELITLWCWADREDGGFEMNPIEIGYILGLSAVFLIFVEAPIYRFLERKFNFVTMTRMSILTAGVIAICFPVCSYFSYASRLINYLTIGCFCTLWFIVSFINLTNLNVLVSKSVLGCDRAKMSALFMISSSLAKGVAPLVCGPLFAVTANSQNPYPFNFAFVFNMMGLVYVLFLVLSMSPRFNYLKKTTKQMKSLQEKLIHSI